MYFIHNRDIVQKERPRAHRINNVTWKVPFRINANPGNKGKALQLTTVRKHCTKVYVYKRQHTRDMGGICSVPFIVWCYTIAMRIPRKGISISYTLYAVVHIFP